MINWRDIIGLSPKTKDPFKGISFKSEVDGRILKRVHKLHDFYVQRERVFEHNPRRRGDLIACEVKGGPKFYDSFVKHVQKGKSDLLEVIHIFVEEEHVQELMAKTLDELHFIPRKYTQKEKSMEDSAIQILHTLKNEIAHLLDLHKKIVWKPKPKFSSDELGVTTGELVGDFIRKSNIWCNEVVSQINDLISFTVKSEEILENVLEKVSPMNVKKVVESLERYDHFELITHEGNVITGYFEAIRGIITKEFVYTKEKRDCRTDRIPLKEIGFIKKIS